MHRTAHAVANILADDAKTIAFDVVLNGPGDSYYSISRMRLGNPLVKRLLRHIHELLGQNATATDCDRLGRVTAETVVNNSNIETYNISEL